MLMRIDVLDIQDVALDATELHLVAGTNLHVMKLLFIKI